MKLRRKGGVAALAAGSVMLLSALLLFCVNRAEDEKAGAQAQRLLTALQTSVMNTDPRPTDVPADASSGGSLPVGEESPVSSPEDQPIPSPVVSPEDRPMSAATEAPAPIPYENECIGILRLPTIGIELPVFSEWSYDRLAIAPCRQFGSSETNDLVIAAHNYRSHFNRLEKLKQGDTVSFTDLSGTVFLYSVEAIRVIAPTEVDAVINSGSDLVLYTCNLNGKKRVTVFCSLCAPTAPS